MSRQRFENRSEPKIPMLVLWMNEPETNTPDSGILEENHSHLSYV